MPISLVQQGLIVQQEFAKLLMLGSGGRIEVAAPLTDDERRDYEIHVRGHYGFGLAIQVKSVREINRHGGRQRYLHCQFPVRATRLVNNPCYWYFIAYLDLKLMRFADPVFLIPSTEFHKKAAPRRRGAFWYFGMTANMEARTRDQWHMYRVDTLKLGRRVLEIMNDVKKRRNETLWPAELPGVAWVRAA
jgi:hypothetical protein